MDLPIIMVSDAERAQGRLAQESAFAAIKGLHEEGAVILRGIYPTEGIDALYQTFQARYGNLDPARMLAASQQPPPNFIQKVGEGRYEIAPRMTGPFGHPGLFANAVLMNFLWPLLGGDIMRLASMTVVASYPGSAMQHIHRDHGQLFHEFAQIGPALPLYAVNVTVPLIDVDQNIGPTAIWPGSHRWPQEQESTPEGMASVAFQRGDAIVMDYRTMHTGMPNSSNTVRPILYMVYSREWFFDDNNHRGRTPMAITLAELQAMPKESQLLLMRAWQQALRAHQLATLPA